MLARLATYFHPAVPYDNVLTEQRARGLLIYLGISFIIAIVAIIFLTVQLMFPEPIALSEISLRQLIGISSPLFLLVFFWAVRNGYFQASAYGIVLLSLVALLSFLNTTFDSVTTIAYAIPIVAAGLLLGWRTTIVVFLIVCTIAVGALLLTDVALQELLILVVILFIINTLVLTFGTNVQITAVRFIDELGKLQTVVNETINLVAQTDENQAMIDAINIIRDQLGYTFARIYMVENDEIIRRIQTGLNLTQINIDTDIQFGTRSGIHEAIRTQRVILIRENDDPLLRQHLLTGTRTALSVPVTNHSGDIIAILDIQSEDLSDYHLSEIRSIEMVAAQLGQTIIKSRTIDTLRRDLSEQDELIRRQRERLLRYEQSERQTTTDTWRDYLQEQGVDYLGYDMATMMDDPIEANHLSDEIQAAIQTGDITVRQDGKQQVVSVPIQLRGQTLGAMSFKVPIGSQVVGARQQELINNVVQRLSLALENKRLFEQSRTRAQRESKANEIGNLLLSSTDVNTVLQLAARSFNETLGAVQTQIRLRPEAQEIGDGVNS